MALHTGEAEARAGEYFGPTLNRAARLMSIGAGGQTLLSSVTAELVCDSLPDGTTLLDLGEHRLKDLTRPERVIQLTDSTLPIQTIKIWQDLGHRAAVANQFECFAYIARAEGQFEVAARLLGAAESLRELIKSDMAPYERPEYEQEVAALREQMDAISFVASWKRGRAMTMDRGVEYALESAG